MENLNQTKLATAVYTRSRVVIVLLLVILFVFLIYQQEFVSANYINLYTSGSVDYSEDTNDMKDEASKKSGTEREADLQPYNIKMVPWTSYRKCCRKSWFPKGQQAFANCQLPQGATCEYIHDSSLYATADAILFKGTYTGDDDLPLSRGKSQTWVFMEWETPVTTFRKSWHNIAILFNITVTFSRRSDVVSPYGFCIKKPFRGTQNTSFNKNYAANKTELVAWFVANCNAKSKRQEYIAELKKHVPVHIYGRCGTYECRPKMSAECNDQLLRNKYKFYLAFENSLCEDYITEKFWKCLEFDTVPVVYGGSVYEDFAPPHSFIDVRDFKSPKHLAEYLILLSQNDKLYNEYFKWKNQYDCRQDDGGQIACGLCSLLHKRRLSSSPLQPSPNLSRIWTASAMCETVDSFRKTCNCWP